MNRCAFCKRCCFIDSMSAPHFGSCLTISVAVTVAVAGVVVGGVLAELVADIVGFVEETVLLPVPAASTEELLAVEIMVVAGPVVEPDDGQL